MYKEFNGEYALKKMGRELEEAGGAIREASLSSGEEKDRKTSWVQRVLRLWGGSKESSSRLTGRCQAKISH